MPKSSEKKRFPVLKQKLFQILLKMLLKVETLIFCLLVNHLVQIFVFFNVAMECIERQN